MCSGPARAYPRATAPRLPTGMHRGRATACSVQHPIRLSKIHGIQRPTLTGTRHDRQHSECIIPHTHTADSVRERIQRKERESSGLRSASSAAVPAHGMMLSAMYGEAMQVRSPHVCCTILVCCAGKPHVRGRFRHACRVAVPRTCTVPRTCVPYNAAATQPRRLPIARQTVPRRRRFRRPSGFR